MKMPSMSLLEWQKRYGTERACIKELAKVRWPDGFQCPECGSKKAYYIETRQLHQCSQCRHQVSVTADTLFHSTKLPLVKWFWAIFLVSTDKRGLSALALSRKIDIGLKCAWTMLHKIRKAMETRDAGYPLAGLIQVDDAFFKGGVNKGGDKRGRGTNKVPVIVMAAVKDEAITFAKMEVVEDVESDAIKSVLEVHVAPGQTVRSDGFPAYNVVKDIGLTHDKQIVYPKHGAPRYDVLKWVNILVSNAKAFILGTYHGVQKKHLQRYLDEFCYRFNRRFWPGQAFDRLLLACSRSGPITYAELRG